MTALIWIIKKIRHLIESSKFSIIIQIDQFATMIICRQKLIISIDFFIRSNIRLVRTSQYFFQFSLDVRHKSSKNNIVSNALSRLSNSNKSNSNDYSELDVLFVCNRFNNLYAYNATLIEVSQNFNDKIIDKYVNDFKLKKHVLLLHKNDKFKKNTSEMLFVREKKSNISYRLINRCKTSMYIKKLYKRNVRYCKR